MNSIALVMIARDEARCIARSLGSARGHVDEMLVLDTGSRDATAAIAKGCGARVAHFDWVDDFAAARNAALDLVDTDWCLVLDADEWLEDGDGALAALRRGPTDFIGCVRVDSVFDVPLSGLRRHHHHPQGAGETHNAPSWLPRLLPRGVRYAGRVHEQPVAELPRKRLSLLIGHDGYRDAQLRAKRGRNEKLLLLALAAAPGDAYLHYQLGKDFDVQQRFADAAPHYQYAEAHGDPCAAWRHDLIVRLIYTLKRTGAFEPGVLFAEREMPQWPHSPDFFFALGDLLLDWAASDPAHGAELLPMIESSWLRAIEIGERPELHDSVAGRGSFLAAYNLAVFHESLGDLAQARFWRSREQAMRGGGTEAMGLALTET